MFHESRCRAVDPVEPDAPPVGPAPAAFYFSTFSVRRQIAKRRGFPWCTFFPFPAVPGGLARICPAKSVDFPLLKQYDNGETVRVTKSGSHVIIDITADSDDDEWWEERRMVGRELENRQIRFVSRRFDDR